MAVTASPMRTLKTATLEEGASNANTTELAVIRKRSQQPKFAVVAYL